MKKRALLIINVGTPNKPEIKEVRKFLNEFLNDGRVIDIPWLLRKILVNLIIIPFRVKKSTGLYQQLWTGDGSPLLLYLKSLSGKLQLKLKDRYTVYYAMRYGNPSLSGVLNEIKKDNIEEIVILPLFPQYASSTTGSVFEKISDEIKKWQAVPGIRFIEQFYNHVSFIDTFTSQIYGYRPMQFDHVVFSYHGLPVRHLNKLHSSVSCQGCACEREIPEYGIFCYKATCLETTRLLVKGLNLQADRFSVGFQSRLSKNWLTPFTDGVIVDLAKNGAKKVLVVAPSFVADCLETIIEIEKEYEELFRKNGGDELVLVRSLNDSDEWVSSIIDIISEQY